jgi:hypothetical protein
LAGIKKGHECKCGFKLQIKALALHVLQKKLSSENSKPTQERGKERKENTHEQHHLSHNEPTPTGGVRPS